MYPGKEGVWDGGRIFVTPEGKRMPRAVLQPPPWVHGSLTPQSRAFLGRALEPLFCGFLGESQQQRALIRGDVLLCLWRAQGSVLSRETMEFLQPEPTAPALPPPAAQQL